MNRFQRLWSYEKLANENVKDEKVIDDEDYNSCFQLRKNLKVRNIFFLYSISIIFLWMIGLTMQLPHYSFSIEMRDEIKILKKYEKHLKDE